MKFIKSVLLILWLPIMIGLSTAHAQQDDDDIETDSLVQFSGVVVTGDSLQPAPFVSIYEKQSRRGTSSDYYGFFSFVAKKGDTIMFSSVGFKKSSFVIPDTLSQTRYSLIQTIESDTILLKESVHYPWPTKEQFAQAFINLDVPDDDLARAKKNLSRDKLQAQADALPGDGSLNFKWQMQQQQSMLYYAGQTPPINLLNPIAWAKFIKAWKDGDFKSKE